jgi:polysaccharide biosynthesis transport protein
VDLKTYVGALRRRWWIIGVSLIAGALAAGILYLATPPTYAASVTFYAAAPVTGGANPQAAAQYAQARVNSYVILMSSDRVAEAIVARTGVDLDPSEVAMRITAEAKLNTVVMTATVHDSSAQRAHLIAQGLADTFSDTAAALDNVGTNGQKVYVTVVSGPTDLGVVAPQLRIYAAIGLAAGLVIGFIIVILLELLDNTVRTADAAAELAGAPVIGSVPRDNSARDLVTGAGRPGTVRAEAFRQMRTNLSFLGAVSPVRVLMITSAAAGEGKSQVAVGLAAAFADAGQSVLLLEADLRRPGLAAAFGLDSAVGLTTVLVGKRGIDDVVRSATPGVDVIVAGSLAPNPSELLGSDRFAEVLTTLRERYDHVIVDTPAVLPVTDAAVISPRTDGIVLVIRSGKTSRDQVRAAVQAVRAGGARVLGAVLNQPSRSTQHQYYVQVADHSSNAAAGAAEKAPGRPATGTAAEATSED